MRYIAHTVKLYDASENTVGNDPKGIRLNILSLRWDTAEAEHHYMGMVSIDQEATDYQRTGYM